MRLVICGRSEVELARSVATTGIAPYIQIVGVVTTREGLIDIVANEPVDVCLSGSAWLHERDYVNSFLQSRELPVPKWVIVTLHLTGSLCLEAAHRGIEDLINMHEGLEGMVERILLVSNGFSAHDGGFPVPPRWDVSLPFVRKTIHDQLDADIMRSLLSGKSNSDIASDVHLSCQTVNNRISQMIHRSETTNRTQLALLFAESHQTTLSSQPHKVDLH